jgi:hypothetical protein
MLRVSTFTPRILEIEGQYVLSSLKQKLKVFLKKKKTLKAVIGCHKIIPMILIICTYGNHDV